jgi:hypothetical protein
MSTAKETARQRRARLAHAYQTERETWGIAESVRRAAAALGESEQELRKAIGLDEAGHYKGAVK